jgi:hypothetical protein
MMNFELEIRRAIAKTEIGQTVVMPIGDIPLDRAKHIAKSFGGRKRFPVLIFESPEDRPGELCFKRVTAEEAKAHKYPEIDALKIGEYHVFKVPPPMHQRIRVAAHIRNRRGLVLLSCTVDPGGLRVTRHPLTPKEIEHHGIAPKTSKYGLESLETAHELRFNMPAYADQMRLRQAVSTKGRLMGWKLRCRLQDDGATMLVVRLQTPQTQGESS